MDQNFQKKKVLVGKKHSANIKERTKMQIVFLFYEQMTALDAIGPYEILSRLPGAQVKRVALHPGFYPHRFRSAIDC